MSFAIPLIETCCCWESLIKDFLKISEVYNTDDGERSKVDEMIISWVAILLKWSLPGLKSSWIKNSF